MVLRPPPSAFFGPPPLLVSPPFFNLFLADLCNSPYSLLLLVLEVLLHFIDPIVLGFLASSPFSSGPLSGRSIRHKMYELGLG